MKQRPMLGAPTSKGSRPADVAAPLADWFAPDADSDYAAMVAELLATPAPDWAELLGPGWCDADDAAELISRATAWPELQP